VLLIPGRRFDPCTGVWLLMHGSMLQGTDQLAVIIEPAKAADVAPLIVEANGLTQRELEVTRRIARGLGTSRIAAELHLSRHTVRDHVKGSSRRSGSPRAESSWRRSSPITTRRCPISTRTRAAPDRSGAGHRRSCLTPRAKGAIRMLKNGKVATRLPAQNLERAKAFYAQRARPRAGRGAGGRSALRLRGRREFALFESAGTASGDHTQMGWEVEDIEATVRELRARGVVFEEYDFPGLKTVEGIADIEGNYPSKGSGERGAWFRDSEGNMLGIGQPLRA
jgi:Bacterial regulatory proteins, luxR family